LETQRIAIQHDIEKAIEIANAGWAVRIATSSSARNEVVGIGGVVILPISVSGSGPLDTFSTTISTKLEQNPYTAELIAIEEALKLLPRALNHRVISIITSNKAAASAVSQPQQQSGQKVIHQIYNTVADLRDNGNEISIAWIPLDKKPKIAEAAKEAARHSTKQDSTPNRRPFRARSTTLSLAKRMMHQSYKKLPEKIGKYSKKVDTALPGKHTRTLYNSLSWKEARILAQLRTGMARLNGYLHQIRVASSDQCACGYAKETVEHFLFRCTKWTALRIEMLQYTKTRRGNLSFYLGGKTSLDDEKWTPDVNAVRATIQYAIATGRLYEG
jgi:ribonuclease HI